MKKLCLLVALFCCRSVGAEEANILSVTHMPVQYIDTQSGALGVDNDGNFFYAVGRAEDVNRKATVTIGTGGSNDVFLSKVDSFGFNVWTLRLGGSGSENPRALAFTRSNEICIMGETGSANFPSITEGTPLAVAGGRDVFVACIDSTGQRLVSSTLFGGEKDDEGLRDGLAIDDSQRMYVMGQTYSSQLSWQSGVFPRLRDEACRFLTVLERSGGSLNGTRPLDCTPTSSFKLGVQGGKNTLIIGAKTENLSKDVKDKIKGAVPASAVLRIEFDGRARINAVTPLPGEVNMYNLPTLLPDGSYFLPNVKESGTLTKYNSKSIRQYTFKSEFSGMITQTKDKLLLVAGMPRGAPTYLTENAQVKENTSGYGLQIFNEGGDVLYSSFIGQKDLRSTENMVERRGMILIYGSGIDPVDAGAKTPPSKTFIARFQNTGLQPLSVGQTLHNSKTEGEGAAPEIPVGSTETVKDFPPQVGLDKATYWVKRSAGLVYFAVRLSEKRKQATQVNYVFEEGTAKTGVDYVGRGGSLEIRAGELEKIGMALLLPGGAAEASFTISLQAPEGLLVGEHPRAEVKLAP